MSMIRPGNPQDERVLILAPSHRDGPTLATVLARAGLITKICGDMQELCHDLSNGAGVAVIAEESLSDPREAACLPAFLERQPPWSEPPIVVAMAPRKGHGRGSQALVDHGNLVLLERPFSSATLVSSVRSALRARRRQYQIRDHLLEHERNEARLGAKEQELRQLNETLERRVRERTAELEEVNRQLVDEIRQRQEAEQSLRHAQKMEAIGQLTGGVAHDFNNLLMVVCGGVNLLERTNDTAQRARILSGMRDAAARGEALTRQLLAFSRRTALTPEPVDLPSLLEGMRILIAGALRGDIVIDIKMAPDLWPVLTDPTQLNLVILNLAVNARDAMPDGGTLTIAATNATLEGSNRFALAGEFVRLEVRDTGVGIPPEILDRVFEPFFTTKEIGKGTGLGLSQVYGFAKQSGGHAEICSREGDGTSVILYLPRGEAVAQDNAQTQLSRSEEKGVEGPHRILLVEDNDAVAALVQEMLEGLGFAPRRVANAREALAALENDQNFDLVFSDIVMPGGMNGIELARAIKRKTPEIPVVLATGYSAALRHANGVDGLQILRKPYDMDTLNTALREAWGGRESSKSITVS
jgi:signal transduction histidine kinase/ActR/RegA family two-component response regulator